MRRHSIPILLFVVMAAVGCATLQGSTSGGGIVIGPGAGRTEPVPQAGKGLDTAARNHIRSAHRFLQKGMPDKARKELNKAEAKSSRSFWYNYYLGGVYFYQGMFAEANRSWNLALQYSGGDAILGARVRTCQSFAHFQLNDPGQTRNSLELALRLDSGNETARGLLADLEADSGRGRPGNTLTAKAKGRAKGNTPGNASGKGKKKISEKSEFNNYFLVKMSLEEPT